MMTMKDNDDILDVLEQHWDRVDEIAERSHISVVRWHLPESRKHWIHSIGSTMVATAAAAVLLFLIIPQPDGFYASDLSHRSEALVCINQMKIEML